MITNDNILQEITNRKEQMQLNATQGTLRIGEIIKSGKEHNALEASKFAVEQVDGRAAIPIHQTGVHVHVQYDLSGGKAGAIPQSVLDQLAEGEITG